MTVRPLSIDDEALHVRNGGSMEYDDASQVITIDGVPMSVSFVEDIVSAVISGRVLQVTPARDEAGDLLEDPPQCVVVGRSATDDTGAPVFTRRLMDDTDVVTRIRRSDQRWGRRSKPDWAQDGCTYPACACRPHPRTRGALCKPPTDTRPNGHEIIPKCDRCEGDLVVTLSGKGTNHVGTIVQQIAKYEAECLDEECGWTGTINQVVMSETPPADDANRPVEAEWEAEWAGPGALAKRGDAGQRFDLDHPAVTCQWCGDGDETEPHTSWCDRPVAPLCGHPTCRGYLDCKEAS